MQIKDKRAIVTGAANGLGLAFTKELLRNGAAAVAMLDNEAKAGEDAMERLNAEFGKNRALFMQCDVTNNSQFDETFKEAVNILGGLDILINNAGIINEVDFSKAIDVNVTAVIRGTLLGIQQMRKDGGYKGGAIVNIASMSGLKAYPQLPVYSATKHAVITFSRSFAQPYHYQKSGVRILVLCPGLTTTSLLEDLKSNVENPEDFMTSIGHPEVQRVESVAHGLVYVIRCAQNGSIWISEDGKPVYEIQLPDSLPMKPVDEICTATLSLRGLTYNILCFLIIRSYSSDISDNPVTLFIVLSTILKKNLHLFWRFLQFISTKKKYQAWRSHCATRKSIKFDRVPRNNSITLTIFIEHDSDDIIEDRHDNLILRFLSRKSRIRHEAARSSGELANNVHYCYQAALNLIRMRCGKVESLSVLISDESMTNPKIAERHSVSLLITYKYHSLNTCSFSFFGYSRSFVVAKFSFLCRTMAAAPIGKRRRSSTSERMKEQEEITNFVSGKNILITGGAAGLGFAFMNHFLKHGANKIVIFDIDQVTGSRIEASVAKSCGERRVRFIHVDVSKHEKMIEAFEEASRLLIDIDIVINNAGILDERRWEREIAVNIGGMISTALLAEKYLSKDNGAQGGTLLNMCQHIDIRCTAQLPVYTATKSAIIGLSQSLSTPYYYEKTGIRVLTLCPGLTETALTIDSPNRLLSRVMKADFVKNLEQFSIQTPYVVAQGLMNVLRLGESGSIWVVESGRPPYEVYIPNPRSLRRHYKNNFTYVESAKIRRGRQIREVCDDSRTGLMSCA
ncbi:uncharacterized protein [Prorops nasuta]|uniref:uncharacterized protein n=1 Tax=Prorops nasuta TaxID=863751 RepID=UPI0034CDB4DA